LLVKVLGNAEIINIFKAVGVPPGAELEDVSKRRYGKLIVMTDADVDGSHIRTLLLTFLFRHLRPLVSEGCVYIAQPPLYRVIQKKKTRYVQTHEEMMEELVELGLTDSTLKCDDGTVFEEDHFRKLVELGQQLEEPLGTLDRRGVDLRFLALNHTTPEGLLPRYRVFLGKEQHWFADKAALEVFLAAEEARQGKELRVADEAHNEEQAEEDIQEDAEREGAEREDALQVIDLHEVRSINQVLKELKSYGITLEHLSAQPNRNGEPVQPFVIQNEDGNVPLSSLRNLLPSLRKMGEKGLKVTRFKETSMNPEHRLLLQVTMEDAAGADEIFRVLMGDHVEPRREFIEKHALEVKDLDV
jgi:DNA gyrase subunit B